MQNKLILNILALDTNIIGGICRSSTSHNQELPLLLKGKYLFLIL